jgi:molybdopterin-guanine dinucleotide biosynthesis protein A
MSAMGPGAPQPPALTAVVLAGGLGTRMGGLDKGLQPHQGQALAWHALQRLRTQQGTPITRLAINANRHLDAYAALGVPVWPDALPGHPGPLAGFLAALDHCDTPWLLTVPCDAPLFPPDLAQRLMAAQQASGTDIAMATAPDGDGRLRRQPVFCLLRASLREDLAAFIGGGGRKVGAWTDRHLTALAPFDRPGDDPQAFFNANTLADLQTLAS